MNTPDRRSKWVKYRLMKRFGVLKHHIPITRKLTPKTFWGLVEKYGDVILKPAYGSRGKGVIRVTSIGNDRYTIHMENERITKQGKEWTYVHIREIIGSYSYIVQRRIPLSTVNNRPFDIRVIVQRRRNAHDWEVTGKVAKVAGEGYIVTNITRSKGTIMTLESVLQKSPLKDYSHRILMSKLDRIAILTARKMSRNKLYSNQNIFGLDMGLDANGRLWVIEVNLKPMLSHFRELKDQTMYQRIMKYKKNNSI
jgi:glutathione synthase/RimK-type ligase-like ATP-grasp enzyme